MDTNRQWPAAVAALLLSLTLAGCGGGGSGGPTAAGGDPSAANGAPVPGARSVPYASANPLVPYIRSVTVRADGRPQVDFQLTDNRNNPVSDLTAANLRLTVAKLGFSPVGNLTGSWQSYLNTIEIPSVGTGAVPRMQATTEAGSTGTLTNNGDGTYRYVFAASITTITDAAVVNQAALEGLDLSYQPARLHRVGIEFRNAAAPANATHDWIPQTGQSEADGLYDYDVVATANCNGCHQTLSAHGGSRVEVRYCVTCHNAGSTDANSTNTVSFKTMIHKIHRGAGLPSVKSGTPYVIYGFGNRINDYSKVVYPGDILDCAVCHGGNTTATHATLRITDAGDNWSFYATRESCGSCHDDLDFSTHYGGQPDDANCMSCHQNGAIAGAIATRHKNVTRAAASAYEGHVISVTQSAPGQQPVVRFAVTDPTNKDAAYNILADPAWTDKSSRLAVTLGWSTRDYTNTGNGQQNASSVSINALTSAVALGDGTFEVTSPVPIPDGTQPPGVPATGSGAATLELHPRQDFGSPGAPDIQSIAVPSAVGYFSIDESNGKPAPRRTVADQEGCLGCHGQLALHGGNRTDTVAMCVTCHNPRNTDRETRAIAKTPPTDGKTEESIDFKTMIHGIHGAAFRTHPLQIVGFGGSLSVFDTTAVQYPGQLNNCRACHAGDSFALPLPTGVLGPSLNTGANAADPADDRVASPMAAVCASCHDGDSAKAHMVANGGNFDTTQAELDGGTVLEQCAVCHAAGRVVDVATVHGL